MSLAARPSASSVGRSLAVAGLRCTDPLSFYSPARPAQVPSSAGSSTRRGRAGLPPRENKCLHVPGASCDLYLSRGCRAFGTTPQLMQCLAVDDCGASPYDGAVITWPCAEGGRRSRARSIAPQGCCPDGSSCNLQWSLHPEDGTVRSFLAGGDVVSDCQLLRKGASIAATSPPSLQCLTAAGGANAGVFALPCIPGNASQLWYFNATDESLRTGVEDPSPASEPLCATAGGAMAADIWGRPLASGSWAFAALNAAVATPASVSCDWAQCLGPATGWSSDQRVMVRTLASPLDEWSRLPDSLPVPSSRCAMSGRGRGSRTRPQAPGGPPLPSSQTAGWPPLSSCQSSSRSSRGGSSWQSRRRRAQDDVQVTSGSQYSSTVTGPGGRLHCQWQLEVPVGTSNFKLKLNVKESALRV